MQIILVAVAAIWGGSILLAGAAGTLFLVSPRLRKEIVGI